MLIIENKKKRLRVKLGLPFCLSSVLNPMERQILSDALYLFDQSDCLCLSARQFMMLSLFIRLSAFISVSVSTLSLRAVCLSISLSVYCLPASLSLFLSECRQTTRTCMFMYGFINRH